MRVIVWVAAPARMALRYVSHLLSSGLLGEGAQRCWGVLGLSPVSGYDVEAIMAGNRIAMMVPGGNLHLSEPDERPKANRSQGHHLTLGPDAQNTMRTVTGQLEHERAKPSSVR